ncbi:MAG: hypothetical protein KJ000_21180 [Pirellulaceae bacterium]|jgi:hypothetical protein|nr:hypothetical protein [Pirellulaceae bacterium]
MGDSDHRTDTSPPGANVSPKRHHRASNSGALRGSDVAFYVSTAIVAVILCAIIASLLRG